MRPSTYRPLRAVLLGMAIAAAALPVAASDDAPVSAIPDEGADGGGFGRDGGFGPGRGTPEARTLDDAPIDRGEQDPLFLNLPPDSPSRQTQAILAAHPDSDVIVCLAGCGQGPAIVSIRPRGADAQLADTSSVGKLAPTAARWTSRSSAPARPAADDLPTIGDVVCLAGCVGAVGSVVQRGIRLTWVAPAASEELRGALRHLADRLTEAEAVRHGAVPPMPQWVSNEARDRLLGTELPGVLARLVASASPLVRSASPLVRSASPLVRSASPLVRSASPLVRSASPLAGPSSTDGDQR